MKVHEKIRLFRLMLGLDQGQMSRYLGVQRSNYTAMETGNLKISQLYIERSAFLVGVSTEWITNSLDSKKVFVNDVNLFYIFAPESLREKNRVQIELKKLLPKFLDGIKIASIVDAGNILCYYTKKQQILILYIPDFLRKTLSEINITFKPIKIDLPILIDDRMLNDYFSFLFTGALEKLLQSMKLQKPKINSLIESYNKLIEQPEFRQRNNVIRDLMWGFTGSRAREWKFKCRMVIISYDEITKLEAIQEILHLEQLYEKIYGHLGRRIHVFPSKDI